MTSAAAEAAPQAIQVADRFHVSKNLTEATQLLLSRCQAEIAAVGSHAEEPAQNESGEPTIAIEEWRPKEPAHVKEVRLTRRAGREARYEQVISGHKQGLTTQEIASLSRLSQRTVQKWLAAGAFPEAKKRRKKSSSFDKFAPYVLKRWQEGERNGLVLWREIVSLGYTGLCEYPKRGLVPAVQLQASEIILTGFLSSKQDAHMKIDHLLTGVSLYRE